MIDDLTLARRLTDAVLAVPGVESVFPVKPIVHLASEGIANVLELEEPDVLVDVDRSESLVTITAHVATARALATPQTLGAAGEVLRETALREGVSNVMVFVKARLIAEPVVAVESASVVSGEPLPVAVTATAVQT